MEFEEKLNVLKCLSEGNRLKIVKIIAHEEKTATDILSELKISQPTLSHHMKQLADTNLVISRKSGRKVHYSLDHDEIDRFLQSFVKLLQPELTEVE